ncbi:MAG: hypothetical protein R3Y63_09340 [Eubacteriales bacterium]
MLKVACTTGMTGCYIGHLFTELEPPCSQCAPDNQLVLYGTLYTGERGRLVVREYGFDFYGNPKLIEKIREGWCRHGVQSAT